MDNIKKTLIVAGLFAIVLVGVVMAKVHLSEMAREIVGEPDPATLENEPRDPGTSAEGLIVETE